MKLIITERQLKILTENSTTKDVWEKDLGGEYLRRYRRNDKTNVKRVQKMLVMLGYDIGHYSDGEPLIDGIYGYRTANAIRQFQEDSFDDRKQWDKIVGPITYTEFWNQIDEIANESDSTVDELIIYGLPDVQDTTPSDEEGDHEHEHDHEHDYEEDEYEESEDSELFYDVSHPRCCTSKYGRRVHLIKGTTHTHWGNDYGVPQRSELVILKNGVVVDADIKRDACGGRIKIVTENGDAIRFCHLNELMVSEGDNISAGQTVALTGGKKNTIGAGSSTGPHVHFEFKKNNSGRPINPTNYAEDHWGIKKPMMV